MPIERNIPKALGFACPCTASGESGLVIEEAKLPNCTNLWVSQRVRAGPAASQLPGTNTCLPLSRDNLMQPIQINYGDFYTIHQLG